MRKSVVLFAVLGVLVITILATIHPTPPTMGSVPTLDPAIQAHLGRCYIFLPEKGYVSSYHREGTVMHAMYGPVTNSGADFAAYVVKVEPGKPVTGHPAVEICELAAANVSVAPYGARRGRLIYLCRGCYQPAYEVYLDLAVATGEWEMGTDYVRMLCRAEGWYGHPIVDLAPGQREIKNEVVRLIDETWRAKVAFQNRRRQERSSDEG